MLNFAWTAGVVECRKMLDQRVDQRDDLFTKKEAVYSNALPCGLPAGNFMR
jgi:hypothetical protein